MHSTRKYSWRLENKRQFTLQDHTTAFRIPLPTASLLHREQSSLLVIIVEVSWTNFTIINTVFLYLQPSVCLEQVNIFLYSLTITEHSQCRVYCCRRNLSFCSGETLVAQIKAVGQPTNSATGVKPTYPLPASISRPNSPGLAISTPALVEYSLGNLKGQQCEMVFKLSLIPRRRRVRIVSLCAFGEQFSEVHETLRLLRRRIVSLCAFS